MTQELVTILGADVQRLEERLKDMASSYRGKTLTDNQDKEVRELSAELESKKSAWLSADKELRDAQRQEITDQFSGAVNPLATPGVRAGNNLQFDDYMQNYYGSMSNFRNNASGRKMAELCAFTTLGLVGGEQGSVNWRAFGREQLRQKFGIKDIQNSRDLTGAVDSQGGALVPTILESAIIILREIAGAFEPNAQNVPLGAGTTKWPRRYQGIDAFWEGELAPLTFDKSLEFNMVSLTPKTLTSLLAFSNQLSQDSVIPLGDYIAGEMAYKFARKIDRAAFNGDGSSQYGGVVGLQTIFGMDIPGTNTANPGLFTSTTSGTKSDWTKIPIEEIASFMGLMGVYGTDEKNWKIYCSWGFYNQVFMRLKQKGGGNTILSLTDGDNVSIVTGHEFNGHTVVPVQVLPRVASGSQQIVCYFGDLSMAAMNGVRRATEIASSNVAGSSFATNSTYMRAIYRGDINIHSAGLDTVDDLGTPIPGPIVAFQTSVS